MGGRFRRVLKPELLKERKASFLDAFFFLRSEHCRDFLTGLRQQGAGTLLGVMASLLLANWRLFSD
jgi:hypothetical protein